MLRIKYASHNPYNNNNNNNVNVIILYNLSTSYSNYSIL